MALQQRLADNHPLNLGSSLADQQQRRVAVEPLNLILLRVAVAAVNAERLLNAEAAGLGGEELRHSSFHLGALAGVLEAGGADRKQPRCLNLRCHVGELELDCLVLADRLAEALALLAVPQCQLKRTLGDADAAGGNVGAAHFERVHHLRESLVQPRLFAAEDVLGRAAVAVKDELG